MAGAYNSIVIVLQKCKAEMELVKIIKNLRKSDYTSDDIYEQSLIQPTLGRTKQDPVELLAWLTLELHGLVQSLLPTFQPKWGHRDLLTQRFKINIGHVDYCSRLSLSS
jgi:hypothetical protein